MPEEETPPKKVARKRVVKKGVRGPKAPKKSVAESTDEETFELLEPVENASEEAVKPEAKKAPKKEAKSEPKESDAPKKTEQPTIEVVEEAAPESQEKKEKEGDKEKGSQKEKDGNSEDGEERRENSRRRNRNRRGGNREEGASSKRPSIDVKEAAEKAWEIYQGELEEEGVSLVDPRRAREIARRCLELATVFCEERDRFLER